jgi:predicted nucleotidyltransferase
MPNKSWTGAEVRFIDRDQVIQDLRRAVSEAKARHPEIVKVLLFGSFVQGTWTAASDADLIVVVRREFARLLDRGDYHISAPGIATDSVVYSESEFERLSRDPDSFLARNLPTALEL